MFAVALTFCSGSRLSLFGRLRDYRSLSALLHATLALTARSASEASPPSAEAASTAPVAENSLTEEKLEANGLPTETCEHQGASDTTHDLLFSNLAQELHSSDTGRSGEADLTNDADIHLLQLLDGDRTDSASPNLLAPSAGVQQLSISHAGNSLSLGETSQASSRIGKSVAVVGRVKLSVDSEVSGYEVLAALEGLGRGKLWLSPFWGTDGRLPDPPEAADDAELLNLLEEEDSLVRPSLALITPRKSLKTLPTFGFLTASDPFRLQHSQPLSGRELASLLIRVE